jgi:nuclear pore complex protein Nup205
MIYRVLDDLNSLYVYEAKMSLFIRIAQTRQGAERLIESRVLPILADCDFLDTLPEADQSFIGMPYSLLC